MGQARSAIAVHGGAGGSSRDNDGCERAAATGAQLLCAGAPALEAVVEAVRLLEDDGRYNAGYGSVLTLDGAGVEMDAAVMDNTGTLDAVTCLRSIRNPVLAHWNYPIPWEEALRRHGSGTVGAVAIDQQGRLAVASSTGGCAPALLGRVGDTPIPGCGFYAGPAAAIAVTGVGEAIVPAMMARTIYDHFLRLDSLERAVRASWVDFPAALDIGVIAISANDLAMLTNRDMPCAAATAAAQTGASSSTSPNTPGSSL